MHLRIAARFRAITLPHRFSGVVEVHRRFKQVSGVRYILENPIRAGLTRELGEYRFAGSEVYDLEGLLTAWENLEAGRT